MVRSFYFSEKAITLTVCVKTTFCALLVPSGAKVIQNPSKSFPKWSQMGSKMKLFSNLPKKSFFGFYLRNNHILTVLGRPFFIIFPVIFLQKRGLRTGTPTNHSKFLFFWPRCKIVQNVVHTPSAGVGALSPFFSFFAKVHSFGCKGVPGQPPGCFFTHFVMDFHSFCDGFVTPLS